MRRFRIQLKYWFVIPSVAVMLVVLIFPLIYSLRISLFYYVLSKPTHRHFCWFDNYKNVLLNSQTYNALLVTLKFSFSAVFLELIFGFVLAYCLSKISYLRNAIMSTLMVPMMITPIAIGLIWRLLLHPELGIVNYLLDIIGIGGRPWLGSKSTALATVVLIDVWQWTPFMMIVLYAGLLSLPKEPFEAAIIDGATAWQQIYYLILPMLRNIITIAVVIRLIDLLRTYDLIYILTRGGPGASTETFSYYVFRLGFVNLDMGAASAASFLFVILIAIATAFLLTRLRRGEG